MARFVTAVLVVFLLAAPCTFAAPVAQEASPFSAWSHSVQQALAWLQGWFPGRSAPTGSEREIHARKSGGYIDPSGLQNDSDEGPLENTPENSPVVPETP